MICGNPIFFLNIIAEISAGSVGLAGITLLVVGFIFVLILTIANAKLKVEQDPKVEAVLNILPGANCGGCGLAGCGAYAEAVVKDHALMGKCGPGGDATVKDIAAILGIEAAAVQPLRAVVHCWAKQDEKSISAQYQGVKSCSEAQMVAGVMGCSYGCLGYGDCSRVCDFDAIRIIDGRTIIDYNKCVGCGACVKACPRQLIEMLPMREEPMLVIACASLEKAKDVRGSCKIGCIGCGLCVKQAPGMFRVENSLAIIDYDNYGNEEDRDKAVDKCPRAMMIYIGRKR